MPEQIRTITVGEDEYRVSNLRGILNPGKFEGEWPHAVRDYRSEPDEEYGFGSLDEASDEGLTRVGHRYYYHTSQGFVEEIDRDIYTTMIAEDGFLLRDGEWYDHGKRVHPGRLPEVVCAASGNGADARKDITWRVMEPDGTVNALSEKDINAYIARSVVEDQPCAYRADVYCPEDAVQIIQDLLEKTSDGWRLLESPDTDVLPQPMGDREVDAPEHCARGPQCSNAILLDSPLEKGRKVGALLDGQSLTSDGTQYVRELLRDRPTAVTAIWAKRFDLTPSPPAIRPSTPSF